MRVQRYDQLVVWQRAFELVCAAYGVSRLLPTDERHALRDQIRRAAVSVPANIAEGHARVHRREFLQFLAIAGSSLAELATHLVVAGRVGYVVPGETVVARRLADEVGRMLTVMRRKLSDGNVTGPTRR